MGKKNLRATMIETQFHRFKRIKSELGASTNDEAIVELMDTYEEVQTAEELEEVIDDEA